MDICNFYILHVNFVQVSASCLFLTVDFGKGIGLEGEGIRYQVLEDSGFVCVTS